MVGYFSSPEEDKDKNKDKDPWTGKRKEAASPDFEETLRKMQKRLSEVLKTPPGGQNVPSFSGKTLGLGIAIFVFFIWFISGIFIVGPAESAVILTLGRYTETLGPGPHWIPRFIQTRRILNQQKIATYSYESHMLTKDMNIVSVAVSVQYRIGDARDYLFNVMNPRESLKQATASALRQVVGNTPLDQILTVGREQVRQEIKVLLLSTLERYNTGLVVTDVALQPARAPDEVKEAFDDAIKAQEDEQRFKNQAEAYALQVDQNAQGQRQRLLADAQAYRQQVVLGARGDTIRFLKVLPEYQRAPEVTRERLYFDAIESVLQQTSKVVVDTQGSNMMYLPLDKWFEQRKPTTVVPQLPMTQEIATPPPPPVVAPVPPLLPVATPAAHTDTVNGNDFYRVKGGYE